MIYCASSRLWKMTTPCRICYDDDMTTMTNPLLNPCECKGSAGAIHKQCLTKWMRIADATMCEICKAPYVIIGNIPEILYKPSSVFLTNTVFCFYTMIVIFGRLIVRDSMQFASTILNIINEFMHIRSGIADAIPFLLLLNIGLLLTVIIPSVFVIRNKIRYARYAFSVRRSLYFLGILGSICATVQGYPFVGSFVATNLLGQLYDTHCHIIASINRDIAEG